jgi:Uma2 family endonuclease
MSTQTMTMNYAAVTEQLPPGSTLILRDVSWDEYEDLLDSVGEAKGFRISFDQGTVQIMTISAKHERYSYLINDLVRLLSVRLHIRVLSFGSATMKKRRKQKGSEPDGCFYVQSADLIGSKEELDFSQDPPPDIVVEVDVQHDSRSKFPIYAALGVGELWRYDGHALTMYHLQEDEYVAAESSRALPMLTSRVLTDFLTRSQQEDQYETLLAFETWLQTQQP